jgi:biotin carboxyl carrier protein
MSRFCESCNVELGFFSTKKVKLKDGSIKFLCKKCAPGFKEESSKPVFINYNAGEVVKSTISGTLWKILVEEGDVVEEGDSIMIVESMKMEQNVISPYAGSVKQIIVNEGDKVKHDDPLVIIG